MGARHPAFSGAPPRGKEFCRARVLAPRWGEALQLPPLAGGTWGGGAPPSCHPLGGVQPPQDAGALPTSSPSAPCLSFPCKLTSPGALAFPNWGGGHGARGPSRLGKGWTGPAPPRCFPPPRAGFSAPHPPAPNCPAGFGAGGQGWGGTPAGGTPWAPLNHPNPPWGARRGGHPAFRPPLRLGPRSCSRRAPSPLLCRPPASPRTPKPRGGPGLQLGTKHPGGVPKPAPPAQPPR